MRCRMRALRSESQPTLVWQAAAKRCACDTSSVVFCAMTECKLDKYVPDDAFRICQLDLNATLCMRHFLRTAKILLQLYHDEYLAQIFRSNKKMLFLTIRINLAGYFELQHTSIACLVVVLIACFCCCLDHMSTEETLHKNMGKYRNISCPMEMIRIHTLTAIMRGAKLLMQ